MPEVAKLTGIDEDKLVIWKKFTSGHNEYSVELVTTEEKLDRTIS